MTTNTKKHPHVVSRKRKTVRTTENWYPTAESGTVTVSLIEYNNGMWRVCVWGEDDFGMEVDLYAKNQAKNIFEKIKDYTMIAELKALGFVRA